MKRSGIKKREWKTEKAAQNKKKTHISASLYNFKAEKLGEFHVETARKLRRENDQILIVAKNKIQKLQSDDLETIFSADHSQIVDKNSASYFVIKGNKLYLYPINQ